MVFKKIIILLALFLGAGRINASFSEYIERLKLDAITMGSLLNKTHQFNFLGAADVSPEMHDLVHKIMDELGLPNLNIAIKQMSDWLANLIGRDNGLATANALFIDEKYIQSLNAEEQRAFIGHELMHIKNKDVYRKFLAVIFSQICLQAGAEIIDKYITNSYAKFGVGCSLAVGAIWGLQKFSRSIEKEADLQSAKILKCHQGGIALNKVVEHANTHNPSFIEKCTQWITSKYSSHPQPHERIAYLTQTSCN